MKNKKVYCKNCSHLKNTRECVLYCNVVVNTIIDQAYDTPYEHIPLKKHKITINKQWEYYNADNDCKHYKDENAISNKR